jgi:hypothetical protein
MAARRSILLAEVYIEIFFDTRELRYLLCGSCDGGVCPLPGKILKAKELDAKYCGIRS